MARLFRPLPLLAGGDVGWRAPNAFSGPREGERKEQLPEPPIETGLQISIKLFL